MHNYKEKLTNQKEKLEGLIDEMKDNTLFGETNKHSSEKNTSGELSSYDNHLADIGTDLFMQDMQNSLTIHEEGKLYEVENALNKIENGTYGICEICHQKIENDRLEILPETGLCSECAKHQPEIDITSKDLNQNLINKGSSFYDDVLLELDEVNENYHNKSDRD